MPVAKVPDLKVSNMLSEALYCFCLVVVIIAVTGYEDNIVILSSFHGGL